MEMPRTLLRLGLRAWAAWMLLSVLSGGVSVHAHHSAGLLEGAESAFWSRRTLWTLVVSGAVALLLWWRAGADAHRLLPAALPELRPAMSMSQAALVCCGLIFVANGMSGLVARSLAPVPADLPDL